MIQLHDDSNTDVVLSLPLPRGTDPAIASSLKRGMEEMLTVVLAMPQWEAGIFGRADEIALAFTRLAAPSAPLIEERIRRQQTMREVFARGDWLTAEQINSLQALPPANKAHPASDWKRRGRIFGVTFNGKEYFAGYQFDAMSQPLPIIRDILEALGPVEDSWKIAAWFHFPNGWIAGRDDQQADPIAPKDALDRRDAVVPAAHRMLGGYVA
jgi:hypothetical protein